MRRPSSPARFLASVAVAAIMAAALGGCQTMADVKGALTSTAEPAPEADPHRAAEAYGERYRANPNDCDAPISYRQAPRATRQPVKAGAGLPEGSIPHSPHKAPLSTSPRRPPPKRDLHPA